MIGWQLPADAILRGFKPMSDAEMPAEHLAAISALEANDMVVLHRSPDRDCLAGGAGADAGALWPRPMSERCTSAIRPAS